MITNWEKMLVGRCQTLLSKRFPQQSCYKMSNLLRSYCSCYKTRKTTRSKCNFVTFSHV